VTEMLNLTELNQIFGNQDLLTIAEDLKFEKLNLRALNLLLGLCQYNSFIEQELFNNTCETLFENKKISNEIFRRFYIDSKKQIYVKWEEFDIN
jgi:hypothetical protein